MHTTAATGKALMNHFHRLLGGHAVTGHLHKDRWRRWWCGSQDGQSWGTLVRKTAGRGRRRSATVRSRSGVFMGVGWECYTWRGCERQQKRRDRTKQTTLSRKMHLFLSSFLVCPFPLRWPSGLLLQFYCRVEWVYP